MPSKNKVYREYSSKTCVFVAKYRNDVKNKPFWEYSSVHVLLWLNIEMCLFRVLLWLNIEMTSKQITLGIWFSLYILVAKYTNDVKTSHSGNIVQFVYCCRKI